MTTNSLTTSINWLETATDKLRQIKIKSAQLDALLLLEEVLKLPRISLITKTDIFLSQAQISRLDGLLMRRIKGEPVAYLRNHIEFYGYEFYIDKNVLIPRPESEAFIELAKGLSIKPLRVADIGCGSGCLGITLKLELPNIEIDLFDISTQALGVTEINLKRFDIDLKPRQADLLESLETTYGLLLVNLPYVPDYLKKSTNLKFEPAGALFGGSDGMDTYVSFWKQVKILKRQPEYILCESLLSQHTTMKNLAKSVGYDLKKTQGLVQLFSLFN